MSPLSSSDPRSAPGSPTPLRRVASAESDEPPKPGQRSGRRKLGSRHGWALGRGGRGGSISQSFSPGDQRAQARERWRTSQALWEAESSPSQDSLSEEGKGEEGWQRGGGARPSGSSDWHGMELVGRNRFLIIRNSHHPVIIAHLTCLSWNPFEVWEVKLLFRINNLEHSA